MAYNKTSWDYTTNALNPTNLNKIEQGIYEAPFNYALQNFVMNEITNITDKTKVKRMLFYDAITGTTIKDRMGVANASTSTDTSNFTKYTEGSARVLDFTVNKYWELPDANDLSFGNGAGTDSPFSIVLLCKMNNTTDCTLIAKAQQGTNMEWELYGGSKLGLKLYSANGSLYNTVYYNSALDTTNYHCIIATYDGTKAYAGMKIYVDDVQVDNTTAGTGGYVINGMTPGNATVGNYIKQSGGTRFNIANYALAFCSIISEALTTSQIAELNKILKVYIGHDVGAMGTKNIKADQFVSTVPSGTAPFVVSSSTMVTNLNANYLSGKSAPSGLIVGTSATQTLTNKTLTAPIISSGSYFRDISGNELIKFPTTITNAVNEITISNAVTGSAPSIAASGDETNISLNLTSKGIGVVQANGNEVWHAGNDGTGSGLDADTVDGLEGSQLFHNGMNAYELNINGSGNRTTFIDFHNKDGTDFDARIIKWSPGSAKAGVFQIDNGTDGTDIEFITGGTGKVYINNSEIWHAGNLKAFTNATYLNNAFGTDALKNVTTGIDNCAFGYNSLLSINDDSYNTAIGHATLMNLTTGNYNIALGTFAGRYYGSGTDALTTTSQSIYIGGSSRASANGNTNEIVIGYNAVGYGSNTAHIGNTSVATISFGAGTGTAFTNRSDRRLKEDIINADTSICYNDIKNLPLHRFKYKDFVGNTGDQHLTGFIADEFEQVFPKAVFKNDHSFPVLDENGQPVMKVITETDAEGNEITREIEETFVVENCASIDTSQLTPTIIGAMQKMMNKIEELEAELAMLKGV